MRVLTWIKSWTVYYRTFYAYASFIIDICILRNEDIRRTYKVFKAKTTHSRAV